MEPSPEFGFIYSTTTSAFSNMGWWKIGVTNNVDRRLKDLSAHSGAPEKFLRFSTYVFENLEDAKKVEMRLHAVFTELGLRVNNNREFYKLKSLSFGDCVRSAAADVGVWCISDTQMENFHELFNEYGILIPSMYFLFKTEKELTFFIQTTFNAMDFVERKANTNMVPSPCFMSITKYCYDDENGKTLKQFLRENAQYPLIAAIAKYSTNEEARCWANDIYQDVDNGEIAELMEINPKWVEHLQNSLR